jgi:acyl-CoA synthetase (AMP-forming)/AMP-acid ligase II
MLPFPDLRCLRDCLDGFPDDTVLWCAEGTQVDAGRLRLLLARQQGQLSSLAGRRVALWPSTALDLAFLLVALDGSAEAMLLLPADLDLQQAAEFVRRAGVDYLIVMHGPDASPQAPAMDVSCVEFAVAWTSAGDGSGGNQVAADGPPSPSGTSAVRNQAGSPATRWIIPTSGTTGTPKLVSHTLTTLTRSARCGGDASRQRWGLLYDLARFAGLQVFFQAFLSGSRLIFTDPARGLDPQVAPLAAAGCTALSATPTLWRKILMSGAGGALPLRQVTLGGEIADAAVLAALARAYPAARITHIYASTEAGVGFSVHDCREGFPADYEAHPPKGIEIKVEGTGMLWLRPARAGQQFVDETSVLQDDEGWINTGDLVRRAGDRYLFLGRASGTINVGGNKVFPEEVEHIVCEVPGVALALVKARRSSITGALVEAVIVPDSAVTDRKALARDVQRYCRERLPSYKVPAIVTVSDALETASTGKILRNEP